MLCYRCEERAKFHEKGHAPRYECGEIDKAVSGCYMYKPCMPVTIRPRDNDPRPLSLNMLSCRVERVDDIEFKLLGEEGKDKSYTPYWVPKEIINEELKKLIYGNNSD